MSTYSWNKYTTAQGGYDPSQWRANRTYYGQNQRTNAYGNVGRQSNLASYEMFDWTMKQNDLQSMTNAGYYGFSDDFMAAQREKRAMYAANFMQLRRRAGLNEDLADFQEATSAFNLEFEEANRTYEAMTQKWNEQSRSLDALMMGTAGGDRAPAQSMQEYSMLAKQAMQDTQAALNRLSSFQMPELRSTPTTFTDPFSGEQIGLDAKFEDLYNSEEPAEVARRAVQNRFTNLRNKAYSNIMTGVEKEFTGYDKLSEEDIKNAQTLSNFYSLQKQLGKAKAREESDMGAVDYAARYFKDREDVRSLGLIGYVDSINKVTAARQSADAYADAAALAGLSGDTEFLSYTTMGTQNKAWINPAEFYLNANVDEELAKITKYTEGKLAVELRGEEEQYRKEFETRKERALAEFDAAERNKKINQQRAASIAAQKRSLQQKLEAQQTEYQETTSRLGSLGGSGDDIQFQDDRPQ